MKASSDKNEIAGLNELADRVVGGLSLAGIAILEGKTDDMKAMLVSVVLHSSSCVFVYSIASLGRFIPLSPKRSVDDLVSVACKGGSFSSFKRTG